MEHEREKKQANDQEPDMDEAHRPASDETADLAASDEQIGSLHGHIIGLHRGGAWTQIVINQGSAQHVEVGTKGRIEGLGKSFTVTAVREESCDAMVKAPYGAIYSHKSVVLNPSK